MQPTSAASSIFTSRLVNKEAVVASNYDKTSKALENLIFQKISNKTRLEKIEADYVLKKIGGPRYQALASRYFGNNDQYFYYSKLEYTVLEFFMQGHIDFLRNIRDVFFYFDLSYSGAIKKVSL